MHDYRNEIYYQIFLSSYIIKNLSKNRNGSKILTIKKLELVHFIIKNHFLLKSIATKLNLGSVSNYKSDLYENGYRLSDSSNNKIFYLSVSFLLKAKRITVDEDGFIDEVFLENIEPSSEFIKNNISIFKKVSSLSEKRLIDLISEHS